MPSWCSWFLNDCVYRVEINSCDLSSFEGRKGKREKEEVSSLIFDRLAFYVTQIHRELVAHLELLNTKKLEIFVNFFMSCSPKQKCVL